MEDGEWRSGARRGSGSVGNHYRVGCGGRHFRGPATSRLKQSSREGEERCSMRARRSGVQKEKYSGGIRRNTGICERRKEYGAGRGRKEDLRTERGERSAKAPVSL